MIEEKHKGYIIYVAETKSEYDQLVECVNEGIYDYTDGVFSKQVIE